MSGTLSALEKNIDKLPKCKAYQNEVTETVETNIKIRDDLEDY